jgi:formylglycine-generating enzyme required for sulfatase activity
MGSNPSFFQGDKVAERHPKTGRVMKDPDSSNYPVETVSWDDAVEFCKELSNLPEEKKAGRIYRLPTEAEWEYACRAGSKTAYSFGANSKSLGDYAWFAGNSGRQTPPVSEKKTTNQTHPVGGKKANKWGLYDMHGNVLEWCSDWVGEYPKDAVSDPSGPSEGSSRVLRNGGWNDVAAGCRSAFRVGNGPSKRFPNIGFRVALSSESENPK